MNEIQKTLAQHGRDIKNLIQSALELSWYSRGAWSYECILNMSAGERSVAADWISKRLEQQAKNPHPIY